MINEQGMASHSVDSFEAYTIYSLEQSVPALLNMMERGKQISVAWPDVAAVAAAAALCQEVAALAAYQNSLAESLGTIEAPCGETWEQARYDLKGVMQSFEKALDFNDQEVAKVLFGMELPNALNHFVAVIPEMTAHIRTAYCQPDAVDQEG